MVCLIVPPLLLDVSTRFLFHICNYLWRWPLTSIFNIFIVHFRNISLSILLRFLFEILLSLLICSFRQNINIWFMWFALWTFHKSVDILSWLYFTKMMRASLMMTFVNVRIAYTKILGALEICMMFPLIILDLDLNRNSEILGAFS